MVVVVAVLLIILLLSPVRLGRSILSSAHILASAANIYKSRVQCDVGGGFIDGTDVESSTSDAGGALAVAATESTTEPAAPSMCMSAAYHIGSESDHQLVAI